MLRALALLLVAAMSAPARSEPAPRQEPGFVEIELRITAQRPRGVVVDRGRNDGLLEGDRVVFHPREGGIREGTVSLEGTVVLGRSRARAGAGET